MPLGNVWAASPRPPGYNARKTSSSDLHAASFAFTSGLKVLDVGDGGCAETHETKTETKPSTE
eukprot:COSAG01_NODE_591_length_15119_cov_19.340879_14_plen_63_part_00